MLKKYKRLTCRAIGNPEIQPKFSGSRVVNLSPIDLGREVLYCTAINENVITVAMALEMGGGL